MYQNQKHLFAGVVSIFAILTIGCSHEDFSSQSSNKGPNVPQAVAQDGVCGSSDGTQVTSAPTSNLCSVGVASIVSGSLAFQWTCAGTDGGKEAVCTALLKIDGSCGGANGVASVSTPNQNLCNTGIPSQVNTGADPYVWQCNGLNGGMMALCSAPLQVNGACGTANNTPVNAAPNSNLCLNGMASSVSGTGPFDWSCTGKNGGTVAQCSAPLIVNGMCGNANNTPVAAAPSTNLCISGTATPVAGTGPFTWSCDGANTGTSMSCSAPLIVNGKCGTSDGGAFASAPNSNLCAAGTASAVAGAGPFTWSCTGVNTGTNAYCSANLIVNGQCGTANNLPASAAPSANLCAMGIASAVTGSGPFAWTCTGAYGGTAMSCSAPLIQNGQCGSANNMASASAPTSNLCVNGTASAVSGTGPFTWSCAGTNGGALMACSAPLAGVCGSANGTDVSSAPSANLCSSGTASAVTGAGPFTWSCAGTTGGTSMSCSANLEMSGACGSANGVGALIAPTSNLCATGTASAVTGSGPFAWSCSGANGGPASSCSAPLLVNGACGSANGANATSAPTSNLCSAGTASAVSGKGPFTWTCAGQNGGVAVSCGSNFCSSTTTQTKQLPSGVTQAMIQSVCPVVGDDNQCSSVIIIVDGGVYLYDTGAGAYDGQDDSLIGVLNLSSSPITNLGLSSNQDIMNLDGDGIVGYINNNGVSDGVAGNSMDLSSNPSSNTNMPLKNGSPAGKSGTGAYGGPNAYYSNISSQYLTGTVNFITPVAPQGGMTYFGLENAIDGASACLQVTVP